jgi:hypothetical protein
LGPFKVFVSKLSEPLKLIVCQDVVSNKLGVQLTNTCGLLPDWEKQLMRIK